MKFSINRSSRGNEALKSSEGNRTTYLRVALISVALLFGSGLLWAQEQDLTPLTLLWANQEQDLIATLKSSASVTEKCSACQKLRTVGTDKAVPALAALLTEPQISHAARYALEGNPSSAAVKALREAAAKTSGPIQAGLIDSLGWRRDLEAVPLLKRLLAGPDPMIASASAAALGRIGGQPALAALKGACDKVATSVQPAIMDGLLQIGEQLLAANDTKGAAAIYRRLFMANNPERIRVAAWRGLVMAEASRRAELIINALTGQEKPLHAAALKTIREIKDSNTVEECARKWDTLPPDAQLAVLDAQVKLGANPLPTLRAAVKSSNSAVRIGAWQALAALDDDSFIPVLAHAAAQGEPAEREAARDALARLHGEGVPMALIKQLADSEPAEKAELLRALGEQPGRDVAKVLLQNAESGSDPVRLAALNSLGRIAMPETLSPLLKLAASSKSEADCEPVLTAVYAVCRASSDKESTAKEVLGQIEHFNPTQRQLVLPVLAELGTPSALDAAVAATRDTDPELAKTAVRVLGQWPNAAAAAPLLDLGRNSADSTIQLLALRGAIEVASQENDPVKRLELLERAMAESGRADVKRQALSQIGQIQTSAALHSAMSHLDEPELTNEAALAALNIAEKLAPSNPKLASETATKVLAQCKNPEVVKRAWAISGEPPAKGPFIQNWLACGPFRQQGVTGAQALFNVAFDPEKSGQSVKWVSIPRGNTIDLAAIFPGQMDCAVYLKTHVLSPLDCEASLLLGSDDGVKAWLNGAVVHGNNVDRGLTVDQDMAPIQLKKGTNDLMLKITQGGGGWAACARIIGKDGSPIKGLKAQAE